MVTLDMIVEGWMVWMSVNVVRGEEKQTDGDKSERLPRYN